MRLSNGFVIDKEKTFGELKFTAVRDVFLTSWFVLDELCRQAFISLHNLLGTWQRKV